MSDQNNVTGLRERLIAGRNEQVNGLQKFTQAQFYDNLTKEQYAGVVPRKFNMFSSSRDTLNPLLNTHRLKARLALIDYYNQKHGVQYARWPAFALQKLGANVWRYKANYAVKAFAAFLVYQEYQQYKHLSDVAIMSFEADVAHYVRMGVKTGAFGAICMLI